ncbi:MAG: aromatic amino acid exporter YddG [Bordetella sp.]|uniref:aromatic amino acid exporter YddG n=1 Tax=Bordetella sp. TaxID=28081 RepID=UPI003F7C12A2
MGNGTGRATVIGLIAIGLWSALALSTVAAAGIPPFELLALCFGVAFVSGMLVLAMQGRRALAKLRQPPGAWLLAFTAIFLYHAFYFFARAAVPPARASLIAYLWPLLIVLFSALAPGGDRLQPRHLAGAALGFAGAALIFMARQDEPAQPVHMAGYLAALGCAVIWSGYSVANRRYAQVPSEMLIGVCGAVALAGGAAHRLFERGVAPDAAQWLAILFLGVGPTGLAFLAWDHATKRGNVPLLGALSYFAPLMSILLLVMAGQAQASVVLGFSVALIVAGAMLASYRPAKKRNC